MTVHNLQPIDAPAIPAYSLAVEIRETYATAKRYAELAVIFALRTGALCNMAKEELPHGEFLPWLEEHCPEIGTRTAQKYMALAAKYESGSYLPETGDSGTGETIIHFLTDVDFPAKIQDPDARKEIAEQVRQVTDERSLTQLYMDFGIIRRPSRATPTGPRGASLDPKDDHRSPEEKLRFARERDIEDISKIVQSLELMIREFAAIRADDFARALSVKLRDLSDEVIRLTKGLQS